MNTNFRVTTLLFACFAIGAISTPTLAGGNSQQTKTKGMAVAYPWVFKAGTDTARTMAVSVAEEILRNAGYASIPGDIAGESWASRNYPEATFGHLPTSANLRAFGKSLKASKVLYGSVSWHTRSIWVNAGPKTISTATVNVYVLDVASGRVVYKKTGIRGRSDERSQILKLALDVLLSPLVTAVSGGPATPQEQRAVQIALGVAYHDWVTKARAAK